MTTKGVSSTVWQESGWDHAGAHYPGWRATTGISPWSSPRPWTSECHAVVRLARGWPFRGFTVCEGKQTPQFAIWLEECASYPYSQSLVNLAGNQSFILQMVLRSILDVTAIPFISRRFIYIGFWMLFSPAVGFWMFWLTFDEFSRFLMKFHVFLGPNKFFKFWEFSPWKKPYFHEKNHTSMKKPVSVRNRSSA